MADEIPKPAYAFRLGIYLIEEMETRGWNQEDLSRKVEMTAERLHQILHWEDVTITMQEAEQLGRAFGVNAEIFLRLQLCYRRYKDHSGR